MRDHIARQVRSQLKAAIAPVTPESVARAKADTQAERDHVRRVTGLTITDDGVMPQPAPLKLASYTILCPRCLHPATGDNDGHATRVLAHHLVNDHRREGVRA